MVLLSSMTEKPFLEQTPLSNGVAPFTSSNVFVVPPKSSKSSPKCHVEAGSIFNLTLKVSAENASFSLYVTITFSVSIFNQPLLHSFVKLFSGKSLKNTLWLARSSNTPCLLYSILIKEGDRTVKRYLSPTTMFCASASGLVS